ncbi:DUF3526 domain-containing protein [Olivibacter sp. LS-1]|jgi:ABC-2 type transport system permease protein|uniref:DUF3526 domain-containing protein n=1 Tax=Olivibacter sp. LS-1 TaxID=2592345 RepID=UPI0011EACE3C|nr:DUF3526 domain-containing protein [Olivibacter sp. LS-1]QEL00675.1 DUF3526 domain-containing protein [Olivibacter sp. LS-1]
MFLLILKRFLRSKIAIIGLSVVLAAGVLSLFIGKQHMDKQKKSLLHTEHFQQEHIKRNVQFHQSEIGLLLYYIRFSLVNESHPLNGLSIGQRDLNSSIQSLTIRNLEGQKYDTDLFNPSNLLAGNLDFSFVLIYLFPLLIIGFSYNLLSEEKEGGTWQLLAAQSTNPLRILVWNLIIRASVVIVTLLTLLLLAILILSLPLDKYLLAAVMISCLYLLFWFAVCFLAISFQKDSSTNAAMLISAWMLLTIIFPTVVNNYITSRYPVPEALATVVDQREGYHEKWDMDKKLTMDKFYAHYPQFRKYGFPEKQSSWLWYYAMQQLGDDDAKEHTAQMRNKLWQRDQASELIAIFLPTLHTQHQLNTIARSGLSNHLRFQDSMASFHEKMRLYFYPRIFENAAVNDQNWDTFGVEHYEEEVRIDWITVLLPSIVVILIFVFWAGINYRKKSVVAL